MQAHANSGSFRYANKRMLVWILADDIYIYIYIYIFLLRSKMFRDYTHAQILHNIVLVLKEEGEVFETMQVFL